MNKDEIEDKLKERRIHKRDRGSGFEDPSHYTPWNLFLPRLKPFVPSSKLYEKGFSALDILELLENHKFLENIK